MLAVYFNMTIYQVCQGFKIHEVKILSSLLRSCRYVEANVLDTFSSSFEIIRSNLFKQTKIIRLKVIEKLAAKIPKVISNLSR